MAWLESTCRGNPTANVTEGGQSFGARRALRLRTRSYAYAKAALTQDGGGGGAAGRALDSAVPDDETGPTTSHKGVALIRRRQPLADSGRLPLAMGGLSRTAQDSTAWAPPGACRAPQECDQAPSPVLQPPDPGARR